MDAPAPVTLGSNLLRPRRSLARRWVIIVSIIVHAAAIGAYVVVGMLRIERLKPERGRISVAVGLQMPEGGGPEPGQKPKDPSKPKKDDTKKLKQVDQTVQPTVDQTKISTDGQTAPTSELGTGSGAGSGSGSGSGEPPGERCLENCDRTPTTTPKVEVKPPVTPKALVPKDFAALRKTPDALTKIQPNDTTKTAMKRDGAGVVKGVVLVCLDATGRITSTKLSRSTGYPDYDALLVNGVRRWEYSPAIEAGVPIPVCSTVSFNFRME